MSFSHHARTYYSLKNFGKKSVGFNILWVIYIKVLKRKNLMLLVLYVWTRVKVTVLHEMKAWCWLGNTLILLQISWSSFPDWNSCYIVHHVNFFPISDGYQTTDVWYAWNPRDDNTSAIFVNNEVELPQFELVNVEKEAVINKYNIGIY